MDTETKKGLKIGFGMVGVITLLGILSAFLDGMTEIVVFGVIYLIGVTFVYKKILRG